MDATVRKATLDDEAAVVAFTRDTWPDHGGDYLPGVFADWVETDGEAQRTFVAEVEGAVVGVVQCVLLSRGEAWMQGMRVAPAARGQHISRRLHEAAAAWASARGASVGRCMVFSWNGPALAAARAAGFEPGTEFRWVHPRPDPKAATDRAVSADPAAAWSAWLASPAREHLGGLGLAMDEPWALCAVTRETLRRAAAETFLGVVRDGRATAVAFRTRDYDRATNGDPDHWAAYGVAAWTDAGSCRDVLAAVARDGESVGADRIRVLVPETVEFVSDAALAGAAIAEAPTFVLETDLAGD